MVEVCMVSFFVDGPYSEACLSDKVSIPFSSEGLIVFGYEIDRSQLCSTLLNLGILGEDSSEFVTYFHGLFSLDSFSFRMIWRLHPLVGQGIECSMISPEYRSPRSRLDTSV